MTNLVRWVYYQVMGSKRISPGMILFTLLTVLVLSACVGIPTDQTEPDPQGSLPQTETAVVDPPANQVEILVVEPQPEEEPTSVPVEEPISTPDPVSDPTAAIFDPTTVSAEVKEMTFADVKLLIKNLNTVIQSRNYDVWITNLTEDYVAYWSDPEILARLSESPVLRRQSITLASLRDYFIHVVYPSRQNDRVDDIEFIGETRIKAIIINPKGERLVLYNLEKIGDIWKIANWR